MAVVSGFGSSFDADKFRDNIRKTMQMGLPQSTSERITFMWNPVSSYEIEDNAGNPYDWSEPAQTTIAPDPVQVPAAVEFVSRASLADGTPFGDIDTPKVVVTVLDVDQELLVDDQLGRADKISFDGNEYEVDFIAPPIGLFSVTVYQWYCSAVDES